MKKIIKVILFLVILLPIMGCAKESYITMSEVKEGSTEESSEQNEFLEMQSENVIYYIDICGAVKNPGVYEISAGSRLFELIELAGGCTQEAAADSVNRARILEDGEQIRILTKEEAENPKTEAASVQDGKVNINNATQESLCSIPGIGESRAKSIISYREKNGPFQTIEEIKKINGIKDGVYEKLKEYIAVK